MSNCAVGSRPHSPADGLRVCNHHLQQLSAWLRDVEDEADQLDARPSMAIRFDRSGGTLASHQSPARLEAIVAADRRRGAPEWSAWSAADAWAYDDTASAFDTLHRWAEQVRDARMLARPVLHFVLRMPGQSGRGPVCGAPCRHESCQGMADWRTVPAPLDLGTERALLSRHLDWIATQPWVDEFHRQLRTLRAQLKAANGTSDPKSLGDCPAFTEKGAPCRGQVWPEEAAHSTGGTDAAARPQEARCDRDPGHTWSGHEIARLALMLEQQEETA